MSEISVKEANKRATNLITDLIDLTGVLRVKEDNKVVWENTPDQDIVFTTGSSNKPGPKKTLYVYTPECKDPNAVLLNPLSEPTTITKELIWFYDTLGSLYSVTFRNILGRIADVTAKAKKDQATITNPLLIQLLSPLVEFVDDKLVSEMETFIECDKKKDIIHFAYKKSEKTYGLYSLFQDPNDTIKNSFKKNTFRKKFWDFLGLAFQEIFSKEGATNVDEPIITHSASSGDVTCPRFKTFVQTYKLAWERLHPFMCLLWTEDRCEKLMDNINSIDSNIEYIDQLAKKTGWMTNSTVDVNEIKKGKNTTAPGVNSTSATYTIENNNQNNEIVYNPEPRRMSAMEIMESRHGNPFNNNRTTSNIIEARNYVVNSNNRFNNFSNPFGNRFGNNHQSPLDFIDNVMRGRHNNYNQGYDRNSFNNNYNYNYNYNYTPWYN